jgi:DnaJ-class molecular chaperone
MLTTIAALILVLLIVISRDIGALRNEIESVGKALICSKCHGSGHDRNAADPEERCPLCLGSGTTIGEKIGSLGQTLGTLNSIHSEILRLWACPSCHGDGFILENPFDLFDMTPPKECETCKGTGMKPVGMKRPIPGRSGREEC